jgi:hypothetical protein
MNRRNYRNVVIICLMSVFALATTAGTIPGINQFNSLDYSNTNLVADNKTGEKVRHLQQSDEEDSLWERLMGVFGDWIAEKIEMFGDSLQDWLEEQWDELLESIDEWIKNESDEFLDELQNVLTDTFQEGAQFLDSACPGGVSVILTGSFVIVLWRRRHFK